MSDGARGVLVVCMSCIWWCTSRVCVVQRVCVSPGAHFGVAGCTFRRPGGHFLHRPGGGVRLVCVGGRQVHILVVRMVILIDFRRFFVISTDFRPIFVDFDRFFTVLVGIFDDFQWISVAKWVENGSK